MHGSEAKAANEASRGMTGSGAEEPRSPNANSYDHKKQLRVIAHSALTEGEPRDDRGSARRVWVRSCVASGAAGDAHQQAHDVEQNNELILRRFRVEPVSGPVAQIQRPRVD